jgi:hypothetical protein
MGHYDVDIEHKSQPNIWADWDQPLKIDSEAEKLQLRRNAPAEEQKNY